MFRFQFALILLLSASLIRAEGNRPPNILILYADDFGFGDLGIQNPKSKIATPQLDKLARHGVRFTDGHTSASVCTPSRYALLTGRYHWRDFHGIVRSFGASVFQPQQLTLPEMLRQSGYQTACIGKWHLGWNWEVIRRPDVAPVADGARPVYGPDAFDWNKSIPDGPLAHGFDHYFGDSVINFPPYCWIEDDRVVRAPDTMMDTTQWKSIKEGRWECQPGPMVSDWDPYENIPTTTQRGVDYILTRRDSTEPFFLYFAFPSPHAPIIPNDQFDGKSQAGAYGDYVSETDHACGRLLQALEDSGQAENTIVVFSSDNGPETYAYARDQNFNHWSAEPWRGLKRDVYEGGHRVPFLVRWPGVTTAGTTSEALVSQIDLMATFAELLEFDLPEDAARDSHSLLPLLKGERESVRSSYVHCSYSEEYAIRQQNWLLILGPDGYVSPRNEAWEARRNYAAEDEQPVELYNLAEDRAQRMNVAARHPDKVAALKALLVKIQNQGYSAPRLVR